MGLLQSRLPENTGLGIPQQHFRLHSMAYSPSATVFRETLPTYSRYQRRKKPRQVQLVPGPRGPTPYLVLVLVFPLRRTLISPDDGVRSGMWLFGHSDGRGCVLRDGEW